MELYEPEDPRFELSEEMLEKFASSRDALKERIKRVATVSFLIYALLISNYFALDLEVELIVKIKNKFAGFSEILITAASFIGFYSLILQNNAYSLENFMKAIIKKRVPLELHYVYSARFFPEQTITRYVPVNLPKLNNSDISYYVSVLPVLFGLVVLFTQTALMIGVNYAILSDIWLHPSLPFWSRATVVLVLTNFAFGLLYLASTRFRLPYRDFSLSEEMDVLKEILPEQYDRKFKNFYREDFEDDREMKRRGFLQE